MPLTLADRVVETTATSGTGPLALGGAVAGHFTFTASVADGALVPYCVEELDDDGLPAGACEVGYGTFTASSNTLSRDLVLRSTNSNALVNLSGSVAKRVFLTPPAHRFSRAWRVDYGDATPRTLLVCPAGVTVERVTLLVTTPFDGAGASLAVGDAGDAGRLLPASDSDPSEAGAREACPSYRYAVATPLRVTVVPGAGASAGSAVVTVDLAL